MRRGNEAATEWVDDTPLDISPVAVTPNSFGDGILDPLAPEALVYTHVGRQLRLVAVEWVSTTPGVVRGFGPLHLNEALGVWVLHAWIWRNNPDGMFADMNPRIGDCP